MQSIWATCLQAVRAWIVTLRAHAWQSVSIFYKLLPFLKTQKQDPLDSDIFKNSIWIPTSPYEYVSEGGVGFVFKLSDHIVVKRADPARIEQMINEQEVLTELNRHPLSPYVIQYFYHTQDSIFLQYMPGDSLASVLRNNMIRETTDDLGGWKVVKVEKLVSAQDCLKWMRQLAAAAAWLEQLGFAHCDIRPENIVLSSVQNIRLIDFDRARRVGQGLPLLIEPYAREVQKRDGVDKGPNGYGLAGPRSEQYSIGTLAYNLTRGHEPYQTEWWGRDHLIILGRKLKRMEFPPLGQDVMWDTIIQDCWYGRYKSIAQLAEHLASLDQDSQEIAEQPLGVMEISLRRHECEVFVQGGVLEQIIRFPQN